MLLLCVHKDGEVKGRFGGKDDTDLTDNLIKNLRSDSCDQSSCGPAATNALPDSVSVNFSKFSINKPPKCRARFTHSAGSA